MGTYALRRVIQMIPLLFVISLLIFMLTALQPGDPVDQLVFGNSNITSEDIARLKAAYGLDQAWYTRYFFWLKQALTGNFGYSQDFGIPAWDFVFQQRLPNTLLLTVPALVISTLIAVPLGIFSAVRQYSALDYVLTFFAFVAVSAPVFWVGALALYFFAVFLPQATGGWCRCHRGPGQSRAAGRRQLVGGGTRQTEVPAAAADDPDAARDRRDAALYARQHA
ncbi:ABC transporter permease [Deinococcus multiflagellatus]|uniref:ABC transporter permease n=1 Tax=Deinococcus multiflagellatus TaxID=1656887 RepID=A0ABW1ZN57_9DEIO